MSELPSVLLLVAVSSCFTAWLIRSPRSWSDTDYYALVQKYSDAASALTAMKSELDKLQEKLEFSEDVRYSLGMENAKLAEEIGKLKQDAERGEEARFFLLDQLNIVIKDKWRLEDRLKVAERSLRIARHKEFKAWKKRRRWVDQEWWPVDAPASWHNAIRIRRDLACPGNMEFTKNIIREYISEIRNLDPYPLP